MADEDKDNGPAEQDDVSFLRTGDIICATSVCSTKEVIIGGTERAALAAEGIGNRLCYLEIVSDKNVPPGIGNCMFYIDQALSVRALREMMSLGHDHEVTAGGRKTLLYGHAVQLKHVLSESCWWIIHPASKQRSEGEKVRVGDDVILVSVATERYLHMSINRGQNIVIASFHQTLWSITPMSSGSVRSRYVGKVFGNDVLRFVHGPDECLTIPENWSDHPQH
uniref:MIR domain-containing protein n=1 Tax=Romanomermis culicivorax TaxID=13658 RepID=A0A915JGV6_ROMCU